MWVWSIDEPHDGCNKKIRRKFQTPPRIIKAETQQAPELSNPPLSVFALSWPWYACLNVGVPLGHPEAAMWTALLCDLLLSPEIKAWRILGAVSWPSCCHKVKSRWTCGTPGGVSSPTWLSDY
jgi:hypothetical protein